MKAVQFKVEQQTWVLGVELRKGVDTSWSDKKMVEALRACPHTKEVKSKDSQDVPIK